MNTKEKRLLRKVLKIKEQMNDLKSTLDITYDKMRNLGITQEEIEGLGKIKEESRQCVSYDMKGLIEEIGEEIVEKYKSVTETTFYRVSFDKNYYKNIR